MSVPKFAACDAGMHQKCARAFTYQSRTYKCFCSCHCDPSFATVCEHNPKSARFTLSSGAEIIERAMCNGATDVSIADGRDMTEVEWQEYCQTVIPARWREVQA